MKVQFSQNPTQDTAHLTYYTNSMSHGINYCVNDYLLGHGGGESSRTTDAHECLPLLLQLLRPRACGGSRVVSGWGREVCLD